MDNFLSSCFEPSGLSNIVIRHQDMYFDEALSSTSTMTTPITGDSGSESDAGSSRSSWSHPRSPPPFRGQTPEMQGSFVNIRDIVQQQRQPERSSRGTKKETNLKAQLDDALPLEELLEEADLKRKRLARKAELARLSRKRKKTRVQELESEVAQLRHELSRERSKVLELENEKMKTVTVETTEKSLVSKFQKICRSVEENPASLAPAIDEYLDAHKSKNFCNQVQIAGYETAFGSSTTYNFVRWILNQNEKFYEDPSGLWHSLFAQSLGCSAAQLQQLKILRETLGPKLQQWNEVESAFAKLCPLVRGYFGDAPTTLRSFVSLLTPTQTGKLFQWVDRFGEVCVKIKV